jgi:glycosyltransferase involved in cell wall biosynthesis
MIKEINPKDKPAENRLPVKEPINKTAHYDLTIIVPVYNEEENMDTLEEKLSQYLPQCLLSACVLFVNDGSTDHSKERIIDICNRQHHFYHLSISPNSGLSAALKAGIDATFSTYTGYIDADLQTTPQDFNLLIPHVNDYEMVLGLRVLREDSFVKKASSLIANSFRRFMTKDGVTDTGCPLKLFKTQYAKRLPLFNGMHRFLPALIQMQQGKVKQIPVRHFPRMAGQAKYNLRNRLIAPFIDCFAFRWMKSRYVQPQVTETNIEIK